MCSDFSGTQGLVSAWSKGFNCISIKLLSPLSTDVSGSPAAFGLICTISGVDLCWWLSLWLCWFRSSSEEISFNWSSKSRPCLSCSTLQPSSFGPITPSMIGVVAAAAHSKDVVSVVLTRENPSVFIVFPIGTNDSLIWGFMELLHFEQIWSLNALSSFKAILLHPTDSTLEFCPQSNLSSSTVLSVNWLWPAPNSDSEYFAFEFSNLLSFTTGWFSSTSVISLCIIGWALSVVENPITSDNKNSLLLMTITVPGSSWLG